MFISKVLQMTLTIKKKQ